MDLGLIHVYYGYGKGKTSAAIGLSLRASAYNKKIMFASFLKDFNSGEVEIIESFKNIDVIKTIPVNKFIKDMTEHEQSETRKSQHDYFKNAIEKAVEGEYDILILDELIDAIDLECVELSEVLEFLKSKPTTLEVVITGHSKINELIEIADYVTEFKCNKHPYSRGISAREGIEK